LQTGFKYTPRDQAQEVGGVRRAVHHPRSAPFLQPQPYDDDNSDEHAEGVFDRHYGVVRGEGGRRDARVGAGYEGYKHKGFDAGHEDVYGAQPRHRHFCRKESLEYIMDFDLPSFYGHLHNEDYLDWIMEVENLLEYMCIPEDRKMKLVALKLKGGASAWWERLKLSRFREGKLHVTSWRKMKRLLNARFLPPDDYRIRREPVRYPYVDQLCDDDVSHLHLVPNHLYKSPNRPFAYEEKFDYGKGVNMVTRVELPSKKKYV
jgi:hypothetical protein